MDVLFCGLYYYDSAVYGLEEFFLSSPPRPDITAGFAEQGAGFSLHGRPGVCCSALAPGGRVPCCGRVTEGRVLAARGEGKAPALSEPEIRI